MLPKPKPTPIGAQVSVLEDEIVLDWHEYSESWIDRNRPCERPTKQHFKEPEVDISFSIVGGKFRFFSKKELDEFRTNRRDESEPPVFRRYTGLDEGFLRKVHRTRVEF